MSSDYYYVSEDMAERKKSAGRIEKGLKRLLIIAGAIFAAQLIWLFAVSPFMPFSNVEIHGLTGTGIQREEILFLAGLNENSSFFSTNVRAVRENVCAHLLVESAAVVKRFPDRLSIFLTPREPAAVTLANIGGRQALLFIDRQGVFFKTTEPGSPAASDLPILSGIENPQLNMRLPASLVSLTENLSRLSATSPQLLSAISEIRIEQKVWDGYDLVLFPVHSPIKVKMESSLTEEKIKYMLLMLNVFENDVQKPGEIDFRSGMGSYILKEQS